jgi:hypothetical protein
MEHSLELNKPWSNATAPTPLTVAEKEKKNRQVCCPATASMDDGGSNGGGETIVILFGNQNGLSCYAEFLLKFADGSKTATALFGTH